MYLFSLILTSFVLSRVLGTISPSGSVSIDCGGQRTFTCTLAESGLAQWTITGLMGIAATSSAAGVLAAGSARVNTTDMIFGPTSTITITGFNTNDNGGTVQCVDISSGQPSVEGMATVAVGPPQCGRFGVVRVNDSCPSFTFTPQGSVLPSTVLVSYRSQGMLSSEGLYILNCSYPVDPQMCRLNVTGETYTITLTPLNNCGSPSSPCMSRTEKIESICSSLSVGQRTPTPTPTLSTPIIIGVVIGGVAAVVIVGVSGWCITILIMSCTCFASLGLLALLKCLCCPCCTGKAMKSSSKQRMRSESPVTRHVTPPAQPPADVYADPQAIRDRKERGQEDKDKIQYAAIDFSAGAGSGAGEVKIHQKEEPVIYTTVQHV